MGAAGSRRRTGIWLFVAVLYMAVFAGQSWLTREVFAQSNPGANDFYPRWMGGCALLWDGVSPYAEETTLRIQRGMYGRPAEPGEDQAAYAYPLHTILLTWPTCLVRDFPTVQAAWMTLLIHATLAGTLLAKSVTGWSPGKSVWVITLVWSVFVYPNMRAILLGQLSLLVFVMLMGALLLVRRDHLSWAGVALAAASVKPQMSFLVIAWLLWWALNTDRRRLVLSFTISLAGMLAVVTWLDPSWISGFIGQLQRYPSYTELGSAIWIMTTYYLDTPAFVEWGISLATFAGLLAAWWWKRKASYGGMLWVTSLTALGTHYLAPRTATTHFAVYILPLFLLFELWRRSESSRAWIWVTLGLVLLGSWALFILTVNGNQESAINYLPIPLLLLVPLLTRAGSLARVGDAR